MVDICLTDQESDHVSLPLLTGKVKCRVSIGIYGVPIEHYLVAEESANVSVATRGCQMEDRAIQFSDSLNVNSLLNECF